LIGAIRIGLSGKSAMQRRDILAGIGFGATALVLPRDGHASAAANSTKPGPGIEPLALGAVQLGELAAQQQGAILSALLGMDEGLLLRPFREGAGMQIGAERLGGWYDFDPASDPPRNMSGFIPGHSFGQYVSALARFAASGNAPARSKMVRLLDGFAPTVTPEFYRDYPLPAYTFDKLLIGLIDAVRFGGHEPARALFDPVTDAALPSLPGHARDRQIPLVPPPRNEAFGWDETYTLPENLYLAHAIGAGERFLPMARAYLLDETYFDPLARGENVLPGRHAYSHFNALNSALSAYAVDGSARHLAAARNGFAFAREQSWATGGWGPNEGFVSPGSGALGALLGHAHGSFEGPCGCWGHFKLSEGLIRFTGDSRPGDSMELLLYNVALGALPLKSDGTAFYYADYSDGGRKTYYDAKCPCCSGTIGQLVASYGSSAFLRDAHGLLVNLYLPATARWENDAGERLVLEQSGPYPLGDEVRLRIAAPKPVAMDLRLRIPGWAGPRTAIAVNGREVARPRPGQFASLPRTWRDGDEVVLTIDRRRRLEPVDAQHPDRVALMDGPLALFATQPSAEPWSRNALLGTSQAEGEPRWTVQGAEGARHFAPYFAIGETPAQLYQHLARS
jgi:hypothetical protein